MRLLETNWDEEPRRCGKYFMSPSTWGYAYYFLPELALCGTLNSPVLAAGTLLGLKHRRAAVLRMHSLRAPLFT